jgi:putative Holliday junction resolvase
MSSYVLGLDVGERRIGVALASSIARLPTPLQTIDSRQVDNVVAAIVQLVEKHEVGVVVVGLPRDLQTAETVQTAYVRAFSKELANHLSVPIIFQDEALTSVAAEAWLKENKKDYTKADIDAEAAVLILRDYFSTLQEKTA